MASDPSLQYEREASGRLRVRAGFELATCATPPRLTGTGLSDLATVRDIESATHQTKKTQEVDVRVAATGRPVRVTIKTADGQIKEDTVQTCQNPDGSWGA